MKRLFDFCLAIILLMILFLPMLIISALIKLTSNGPSIYWSDRIGKNNKVFKMPKFRTMRLNTPDLASHLMNDPDVYISPIGGFLRSSSLDELPQIFSVLKGNMSFVGPRPALFNQNDLIALRTDKGIENLFPGITGWAQINGRDDLSINEKVKLDVEYLERKSFLFDMQILFKTFLRVINQKGVSH
jgi:O-antigen biosynthesis protein WbqP